MSDQQIEGAAYIFRYDGESWYQVQKLVASDGHPENYFGSSVAISGDYAIVGACHDGENGVSSGAAYIFYNDNGEWIEQQKLEADGIDDFDWFGYSVSLSDNYAIVGSYLNDNYEGYSGAAYVYHNNGNDWIEQQRFFPGNTENLEYFGLSVSVTSTFFCEYWAVVGASGYNDDGEYTGYVYLYNCQDESWYQYANLEAGDGIHNDHYGKSVSLSDSDVIVGASHDDVNGTNSGSVYLYNIWETEISNDLYQNKPSTYLIEQTYPNPFNNKLNICVDLQKPSDLQVQVFNITGNLVAELTNGRIRSGYNNFVFDAADLTSGTYYVKASVPGETQEIRKVVLVK